MVRMKQGMLQALVDPQEFAYYTGKTLRGLSFSKKNGQWSVIFRANDYRGEPIYSMFVAVDLEVALEGLFRIVTSKGGERYWYRDKYAK